MYLLVIILDKASNLEQIIGKWHEIGVTGATIFDSVGVGRTTLYGTSAPVIASLRRIFDPDKSTYNHTLMSIIRTEETLQKAIQAAQEVCGDFQAPDTGILFTIKLERVIGFYRVDDVDKEG